MDERVDIMPCPFCGSLGVAVVGSFVRCGGCGAVGPYGYSAAEAVQRWNERTGLLLVPGVNEAHALRDAEGDSGAA